MFKRNLSSFLVMLLFLMFIPFENCFASELLTEKTINSNDVVSATDGVIVQNNMLLTAGQSATFTVSGMKSGTFKFLLLADTAAKEGVKVTLTINGNDFVRSLLPYYTGTITHSICRTQLNEGNNTLVLTVNSGSLKMNSLKVSCVDLEVTESENAQEFSVYDYTRIGNEMYYVDAQKAQGQQYVIIYADGIDYNFITETNGIYSIGVLGKSGHSSSTIEVKVDGKKVSSGNLKSDYEMVTLGDVTLIGGEVNKVSLLVTNETLAYIKGIYITKVGDTEIYKEFYVSPDGNDENSGNSKNPFKTIKNAKNKVAEINEKMTGDIVVNILPGTYKLDETEIFDESHSGKNGHRVIFKGADESNPPKIIGGRKVESFEKENGIWKAPLDNIDYVRNLYIDTYPAIRARSSFSYEYVADYHIEGSKYEKDGIVVGNNDFTLDFKNPADLELVCLDVFRSYRIPVEDVIRKDDKTILILNRYTLNSISRFTVGSKFYLENAIEFLDEPGEFYWDSSEKIIHYFPYENEYINEKDVYVGETELMVKLKGKSNSQKIENITFDNIVFRYGAWNFIDRYGLVGYQSDSKGLNGDSGIAPDGTHMSTAQFQVDNAEGIEITNCEFSCLGSIAVSMVDSVLNSKFEGNIVRDTSATGVMIGSPTHAEQRAGVEVCTNIEVKNNVFLRVAGEVFNNCAISTYYENNIKIQNNTIKDVPYTAISVGWGWEGAQGYNSRTNDISYNKIINPMAILDDGGGIYTLGKLLNTKIYNNYVEGARTNNENVGIYLDAGSNFIDVYSNVVKNMRYYLLVQDLQYLTGHINAWDLYSNRSVWAPSEESSTINVNEATIIAEYYEEWQKEAKDIYDASGSTKEYVDCFPDRNDIRTTKLVERTFVTEQENVSNFLYSYKRSKETGDIRFNIATAKMYEGSSISFDFNIKKAGNYKFLLHGNTYGETTNGKLTLNDTDIKSGNLVEKSGIGVTTFGRAYLSEGKNTVSFKLESGTIEFNCIEIQCIDMPICATDKPVEIRAYDYKEANNEYWYVDVQRKDAYYFIGENFNEFCPVYVDNQKVTYSLDCELAGTYEVYVYASNSGTSNVKLTGYKKGSYISFGNGTLAKVDESLSNRYRYAETVSLGQVSLGKGKNEIRIKSNGGVRLFKIILKKKLENKAVFYDEYGKSTNDVAKVKSVKLTLDDAFNGRTFDVCYALYRKDSSGNTILEKVICEEKVCSSEDTLKELSEFTKEIGNDNILKVFVWSDLTPKCESFICEND